MPPRRSALKKNSYLPILIILTVSLLSAPAFPQERIPWREYKSYDVPFVPTPVEVVDAMLELAKIQPGDLLYDLGCGDGRIVIAAAKTFGIKAIGIDIDPIRISESKENATESGVNDKVKFIQQDLFETDFSDASVITMYLLTSVNRRLRPKLLSELKPGTRLVSHRFDMGEWKADKTVSVKIYNDYGDDRKVYFWVVPANVTGQWQWDFPGGSGSQAYVLTVNQKFQGISGKVFMGGFPVDIGDPLLKGDTIRFTLEDEINGKKTVFLYEGKVRGHSINGTIRPAGDSRAKPITWKAARNPKTAIPLDSEEKY
jgi:SAM-dependent methyltransferase